MPLVESHRYPAISLEQPSTAWPAPLHKTDLVAAFCLPSRRRLSIHTRPPPPLSPNERYETPQLVTPLLALWRDGRCEALLTGMEKIGYFAYSDWNKTLKIVDLAELSGGDIAALVWGDKDSDGYYSLLNITYLWSLQAPDRPERLPGTAWRQEGEELLIWQCEMVSGGTYDAARESYCPEQVLRRLVLNH